MNAGTCSGVTSNCPFGLRIALAIFAINLFGPMPADVRKLCDDVMGVIENNGEVTIPNGGKSEPLLTKREILIVALFAGGIAALVLARLVIG